MKRRHVRLLGLLALSLTALVLAACGQRPGQDSAGTGEQVTVFVGDLSASATAGGTLQPRQSANLAFTTQGRVADLLVEVGDTVEAGQSLIRLESDALERALQNAEESVIIQEANLAQLTAPASAADLAAAQANVASAAAGLQAVEEGATAEQTAQAAANVRAAQANRDAAQARLAQTIGGGAAQADILAAENAVADAQERQLAAQRAHEQTLTCTELPNGQTFCPPAEVEEQARYAAAAANAALAAAEAQLNALRAGADANAVAAARAQANAAQANLDAAQANLDLLQAGSTPAQLAQAQANLAQAAANLSRLQDGAGAAQVAQAEAAVAQARIGVERAAYNLAQATLTAPFAGTVTALNVEVGEQPAGPVLTLADTTAFEVALAVDELDLASLEIGQRATVVVDAFAGTELTGAVTTIAPRSSPSLNSAVVTYEVRVALEPSDLPLRINMTANADLVTAERQGVLLVPNRTIAVDRQRGTYTVNRVSGSGDSESVMAVEVTIGLRDAQFTEIRSGLSEGDVLVIGNSVPTVNFGPPEGE